MLKRVIHNWEYKLARRDNNRIVRPFEWGLEFLGDNSFSYASLSANGKAARDVIFDFNEYAISRSEEFFFAPPVNEFQFDGEWLRFPSTLQTPYGENNTVH